MEVTETQKDAIRGLYAQANREKPAVGRTVGIIRGKHRGKHGKVFWHGKDRYDTSDRYRTNWVADGLNAAFGRHGYRIGIETDDGDRIFTRAEYGVVCVDD